MSSHRDIFNDPIFDKYMEELGYTKKLHNDIHIEFENMIIDRLYQKEMFGIFIGYRIDNGNLIARLNTGNLLLGCPIDQITMFYAYILEHINGFDKGPKIAFKYIKEKQLEELSKPKKCPVCGSEPRFLNSFKHSGYWVYRFICDNCKNTIYNTYDIDKNTGLPKLKMEEDKNERLF